MDADQADALTGKLPPAQPLLTIPNSLTVFRIALVPFLVVAYLHSSPSAPLLAAATFCLAAITDWADGYLARRVRTLPCSLSLATAEVAELLQACILMLTTSNACLYGCKATPSVRCTSRRAEYLVKLESACSYA